MTLTDIEQRAVDSPSPWARKHIQQYLETDGGDVDHPRADSLILLYTTGRRSGTVRRTPVVSHPDQGDLIVIASKGGAPNNPLWFLNLRDDPAVWVRDKDDFYRARAEIVDDEGEYARLWAAITEWAPGFQEYQDRTERTIPLVRLIRV